VHDDILSVVKASIKVRQAWWPWLNYVTHVGGGRLVEQIIGYFVREMCFKWEV
jgi:hypothetical protein